VKDNKLELMVHIHLRQAEGGGSGIELSESVLLRVETFLEAAEILGDFHKLVEKLKSVKG
jgi:hypothetical protein